MAKSLFIVLSGLIAVAGAWLASMEMLLKHSGYQGRTMTDVLIALQGVIAALACRDSNPSAALRLLLLVSALGLAYVGVAALIHLFQQPHFEGFVLVIGIAIILQAGLTAAVMLRPRLLL